MLKKVLCDKLVRQFNNKHHDVVPLFDGAKTECMEDCIKPTGKIFLHCGTNNLLSSEDPETNAKKIMNLDKSRKTGTTKTAILGIIPRRDTFNQKA